MSRRKRSPSTWPRAARSRCPDAVGMQAFPGGLFFSISPGSKSPGRREFRAQGRTAIRRSIRASLYMQIDIDRDVKLAGSTCVQSPTGRHRAQDVRWPPFLFRGRMCCGIVGRDLMVRIPDDEFEAVMGSRHVRPWISRANRSRDSCTSRHPASARPRHSEPGSRTANKSPRRRQRRPPRGGRAP